MKRIVWWSAGAASTIAAQIHLEEHPNAELVYCDPGSEHPDNERFRHDVEQWLQAPIRVLKSELYADTWDVWEQTRYLVGNRGTRCTVELKKRLRQQSLAERLYGLTNSTRPAATSPQTQTSSAGRYACQTTRPRPCN